MLRPLLCPVPSPSAHPSLQATRHSAHLRPKWFPPPPTRARPPLPPAGDNSPIIHNAIGIILSAPAPSMPPCPSEPRSDNDMPPLISDSSSDSDTYTSRRKTTITGASSYLLRLPLTPPTPPKISSSRSLLQPPLLNLHPTPTAATYSPPPGSTLHLPLPCLSTAEIAHLPHPRHHLSGLHITNFPSSPRSPHLACLPLGRNAKFASQLPHPLSPPAVVHLHQHTHGTAPPECPPLHHSEGSALARHRSGLPPVPALPTMARSPPHRPSPSMPAPVLPPALPHHDPPSPLSHTCSERSADNSLVARRRQWSPSSTLPRRHEPLPPSRVSRRVRSVSSTPTRTRDRPPHTTHSPSSPLCTDLPALIMLQERLLRWQRQRQ